MPAWSLARASKVPIPLNAYCKVSRRLFVSFASPDPLIPLSTSVPSDELKDTFVDERLKNLKHALSTDGNPSRVWSQYTGLLNTIGHKNLPLEIHQQVLRKCTSPRGELRSSAVRRSSPEGESASPHIHEGRFQAVIRSIRALGMKPDLEDYHFILEQFAAVGHHVGAMRVYKELVFIGLEPNRKTFSLAFQAITRRLTLPIPDINRPRLVVQTKKMTRDLLDSMRKYCVPMTSVNLDLCMRILKETLDWDGFDSFMKWGYGIDLSNPDRTPLEYIGIRNRKIPLSIPDVDLPALPGPLPFSTAALNTTIDMLGRLGNASKLVQAFEVLTQPLPQANQHLFSSFDDDDFGVPVVASDYLRPPYAEPNTTTFSLLIRHLCRMGHATLARHYLIQLMELDKIHKHSLRVALRTQPLNTVTAPRIGVNRGALLPVFGESNRDKNVGLMRWLNTKLPRIIRKKRAELQFFMRSRQRLKHAPHQAEFLQTSPSPPIDVASTSKYSRNPSSAPAVIASGVNVAQESPASPSPTPTSERKLFAVDTHIQILERDLHEIEELARRVDDILGRTVQRMKERLGRRVWGGRDMYLHSDGRRVTVSKDRGMAILPMSYCLRRHFFQGHPIQAYGLTVALEWTASITIPLVAMQWHTTDSWTLCHSPRAGIRYGVVCLHPSPGGDSIGGPPSKEYARTNTTRGDFIHCMALCHHIGGVVFVQATSLTHA